MRKAQPLELDDLLQQVGTGSTEALARLYDATRVDIYAFALSILKNTMDAEDALQDCYVQIFNSASGYVSQAKPMAWIMTITKNLCYKRLKERSRNLSLVENWEGSYIDPDDKLVLESCMTCLSDEERQIVVLHAVSGMKHRQIAAMLDLALPTVLSKYHRAIKKLKANL